MKVLLTYICVTHGPKTYEYASRFVGSYLACPPMVEHETVVVCNGGPLETELACLFLPMNVQFYPRANDPGWDISAYQDVAQHFDSDMMVCCGESVYFHKAGWMLRLVQEWMRSGPGFYGMYSSHLVRAHLNTTAFACESAEIAKYPKAKNREERYQFEHGENSLWRRMRNRRKPTKLVTWDGVWEPRQWRVPHNILWRGDQSNCLVFCNHTERFAQSTPEVKQKWAMGADQQFR